MYKAYLTAGAAVAVLGAAAISAATAKDVPPVANYWVDVATASGFGAGIAGGKPNMSQIMGMMSGRGSAVTHTLDLRLASKQKAAAPEAQHFIPPGLQMGASLPLVSPVIEKTVPSQRGETSEL